MERIILHVDFDSFFASCEQHFNPNLRNRPIAITAENGRNCIIAASREAKELGIKSPSTTFLAKRIYPDIIFVKADFERYLEITKKLIAIATSYSPLVEVFSLDEVFIDLTPVKNLYSPYKVMTNFKEKLKKEVGSAITVSMGVSYNKLLAKLATNLNKPDGYAVIDTSNKDKVFSTLQLTDIMGIGERYKRRLNAIDILTFKDLAEYPMHLLRAEFGTVAAHNLKALSLGMDNNPVISYLDATETKSVGRNYCLPENEYSQEKILKTLYELAEEIAIKLRRLKMRGRTIWLYLHGNVSYSQQKTIGHATDSSSEIFKICSALYKSWNMEYVRQISIGISNLIEVKYLTPSLFDNPKSHVVNEIIDKINDKFGHHTIRSGYLVNAPKLTTKPNGFLADRWQRQELRSL